jgi:uncharacterized 2Fe-2S/4Fe-4S cluster protein (DUF4445 family)
VKVKEGEVTRRENPHLTPEQIKEGWVLSCVARVAGDLRVEVPPREERRRVVSAASRAATEVYLDWPRYPAATRLFLELPPPSLEDSTTDLERLRMALERETGIESLSLDLLQIRRLPQALREAGWRVTAIVEREPSGRAGRLIDLRPGRVTGPLLGVAVDIGTTNVVVYLVDLNSGRLLDTGSALNKQTAYGEDVISRIIYSQRDGGLAQLQSLALETINEILEELCRRHNAPTSEIYDMVVAGNTTMIHLFLGLSPKYLREEPYVPVANFPPAVRAGELGVATHPNASVHCLPGVAAYVGSDITAGVLGSGLYKTDKLTLFLDVGTNGEIVLGNSEWLMTDACSAGPAFEGAGIACGMRAIPGAIEDVSISSQSLEPTIQVIDDLPPQGICGSGLISCLAEMLITGVVSKSGRINFDYVNKTMGKRSRVRRGEHGTEYVLVWAKESGTGQDIVLTEVDINNLIRAKGAIYAGIVVMLKSLGIAVGDIEEVLIGGAFGQHINVEEAILIGLLPDLPWERFRYLGNTSALGAYNALLSLQARVKAQEVARRMTYLELVADNRFMDEFTAALFLPHTQGDHFPSVRALLEKESP